MQKNLSNCVLLLVMSGPQFHQLLSQQNTHALNFMVKYFRHTKSDIRIIKQTLMCPEISLTKALQKNV